MRAVECFPPDIPASPPPSPKNYLQKSSSRSLPRGNRNLKIQLTRTGNLNKVLPHFIDCNTPRHLWYFVPLKILNPRYTASSSITRISWCGKVSSEKDRRVSEARLTSSERP